MWGWPATAHRVYARWVLFFRSVGGEIYQHIDESFVTHLVMFKMQNLNYRTESMILISILIGTRIV